MLSRVGVPSNPSRSVAEEEEKESSGTWPSRTTVSLSLSQNRVGWERFGKANDTKDPTAKHRASRGGIPKREE